MGPASSWDHNSTRWHWATARVIWREGKDTSFMLASCKLGGCFPAQFGHWEGERSLHLYTSPPDALGNYLCMHSTANPHSGNGLQKHFSARKTLALHLQMSFTAQWKCQELSLLSQ